MKRIITATAFILACSLAGPLYATDNSTISHKIDSLIQNHLPVGVDASVYVWDLSGDSAVYAHREKMLNRPASTMKVLTAFTALKTLGPDFNFTTCLKSTAQVSDSVLHGDLYLTGGFDPQLTEDDLKSLVSELKNLGIRSINGSVLADVSMMDSIYWGSGWAWDDTPNSFQPYITPLMIHGGFVTVTVKPGLNGMQPIVTIAPKNHFLKIDNMARTNVRSLGPINITRDWISGDNTIIVTGNSEKATGKELNIYKPHLFALSMFLEYLDDAGISYESSCTGRCPSNAEVLASTYHSLKSVMKETLKESINLNAEAMLLQTEYYVTGHAASFNSAGKFLESFLKRNARTGNAQFMIVDGSGLSMYDNVPATVFIDVLRQIYQSRDMFEVFYDCLPVSGRDGTLKGRLNSWDIIDKVHAKTGTLTGSCTLAGYAKAADGRDLAFCIMNSGALKMAPSRRFQDALCTILCR